MQLTSGPWYTETNLRCFPALFMSRNWRYVFCEKFTRHEIHLSLFRIDSRFSRAINCKITLVFIARDSKTMIVESSVNSCQIILYSCKNDSQLYRTWLCNLTPLLSDKSPVYMIMPRHLNNFISLRRQEQPQFRKSSVARKKWMTYFCPTGGKKKKSDKASRYKSKVR